MSSLSEPAIADQPWMAESMRLTFFVKGDMIESGVFQALTGREPDVEQITKRGPTSTHLAAGKDGQFHLNVMSQPDRIDVHVSVSPVPENPEAVVGNAAEFEKFARALASRASGIGAMARIGVGIGLIKICRDTNQVYSFIKNRFPCLDVDPDNCDDLIFQINSPLLTKDEEFGKINRIDRWSHGVFESINIPTSGPIQQTAISPTRIEGVKLDLDYNTAISSTVTIRGEECSRITTALIGLISEKAAKEFSK